MSKQIRFVRSLRQGYVWILLVIIYLPLFVVILISFNGTTQRDNMNLVFGVPDTTNEDSAYAQLATDPSFVPALVNSLIVGAISTPIATLIATLAAFGVWRGKQSYTRLIVGTSAMSIATPEIITALSLVALFTSTWLSFNRSLGLFTIIVSHITFCMPFAFTAIYPRMCKMNKNLILASYDLGYSRIATFFRVVFPFLLPAICSGAGIAFAMSFDDFIITNLVRGSTQTIATQLYSMRKGVKAWAVAFGAIVIFLTLAITLLFALHRYLKERRKNKQRVIADTSPRTMRALRHKSRHVNATA